MSLVKVELNDKKFFDSVEETKKEYIEKTEKRALAAAYYIHSEAVKSVQTPSSGEVQTRYRKGIKRIRTASKPGDAPNIDSGRLISSMHVRFDKAITAAIVSVKLKYAFWLEFGTKHMKARPFLGPAFDKYIKNKNKFKW